MDLRRFITLKTVVEEGSFLRASQKLCCTQSTVTFHIQQLEREFSLQLFEKIGRRMGYPFSGIVFTRRCRRFFARLFLHVSVWLRSSS